jgi:hypothetical protein
VAVFTDRGNFVKKFWVRLLIGFIKKLLASFVKFNVRLEGHRQRRLDYLMWGMKLMRMII